MTTLDVKRWALNQLGGMSPMPVAENGKYILITGIEYVRGEDFDALQAELDALKSALQLAKPAIEDAANAYEVMSVVAPDSRAAACAEISKQLRALAEIVK